MHSESLASPLYGTGAPVSLESTWVKGEEKRCSCCWHGHKVVKRECARHSVGFALFAACVTITLISAVVIPPSWTSSSSHQKDYSYPVVVTAMFGFFTVASLVGTIFTCRYECKSYPPEDDEAAALPTDTHKVLLDD
ncbi:MAG: hypothetical protein JSR46_05455 [Verrucomicrobia bacterium]|nr:hypothetical protein [Verrucomicrobiota bacterium]